MSIILTDFSEGFSILCTVMKTNTIQLTLENFENISKAEKLQNDHSSCPCFKRI